MEGDESSWSEKVEDLVETGKIDAAISLLESLTSKLEALIKCDLESSSRSENHLQLASALFELAKLYDSEGFSLKADAARSRAISVKHRSLDGPAPSPRSSNELAAVKNKFEDGEVSDVVDLVEAGTTGDVPTSAEDDWETLADRAPDELLPSESVAEVSKLSLDDSQVKAYKRRGRGCFSYQKHGLYSDDRWDELATDDQQDKVPGEDLGKTSEVKNLYGTLHVLVLDGFKPSTRTIDLEKLFENFKDRGFVIRWVNDTLALAVFRTPAIALEACNSVHCSFSVRILKEDDSVMGSISPRDLEPPRQRPQTSAQTAQRLIAQGMGIKLPATFGSRELRKQEENRRNRITARQNMRDDAWGPDDVK